MAPVSARGTAAIPQPVAEEPMPGRTMLVPRLSMLTNLKGTPYYGGDILWHPTKEIAIMVAATSETTCRILSFDAQSGCQLQTTDCRFLPAGMALTPDGSYLALFSKSNSVATYSTSTLRRESMHHLKSRKSDWTGVVLASASTRGRPLVYFTLTGSPGLRLLDTNVSSADSKTNGASGAMIKLRCEASKAAIRAIGVHPADAQTLFLVTVDGDFIVARARVAEGAWQPSYTLSLGPAFKSGVDASSISTVPHPLRSGWALVSVRTSVACVAVEVHGAQEARVIGQLAVPVTGSAWCGAGFVHRGRQLVVAARLPAGDVTFRAIDLVPGAGGALVSVPTTVSPGTAWEASGSFSSDPPAGRVTFHSRSGMVVLLPSRDPAEGPHAAAPGRLRLLQLLDAADPAGRLGAVKAIGALDSSPGFWTYEWANGKDEDIMANPDALTISLHFPRYAHVIAGERVTSYDLTHGLLTDALGLPPSVRATHRLVYALRAPRRGLWIALCDVLSDDVHYPGARAWTAIRDAEAALLLGGEGSSLASSRPWFLPGASVVILGTDQSTLAVLSESGRSVSLYDTAALLNNTATEGNNNNNTAEPRPIWTAALADAGCAVLLPGPPAHVAGPAEPKPKLTTNPAEEEEEEEEKPGDDEGSSIASSSDDENSPEAIHAREMREWEAREAKRLEPPRLVAAVTRGGTALALFELPGTKPSQKALAPKALVVLEPGEKLVELRWQSLTGPGTRGGPEDACQLFDGITKSNKNRNGSINDKVTVLRADSKLVACVGAAVTTKRVLLVSERLVPLVYARIPSDAGVPVSSLWLGPALLVSTSSGRLLHVRWDGVVAPVATLLDGPPPVLLGALADRVLLAVGSNVLENSDTASDKTGIHSRRGHGGVSVAARSLRVPELLFEGWIGLGALPGALPGGQPRVAAALRCLARNYDLTRLSMAWLQRAAATGHGKLASALAARSEERRSTTTNINNRSALTPNTLRSAIFAAMAGEWSQLVELLLTEWQGCSTYPGPAAQGSTLAGQLLAVARVCERHGRLTDARRLFHAAGAWPELLALCAFQGDWAGLAAAARAAGDPGVTALADQMLAVNEDSFRGVAARSAYGGRACVADWDVQVVKRKLVGSDSIKAAVHNTDDEELLDQGTSEVALDDEEHKSGDELMGDVPDSASDTASSMDEDSEILYCAPAGRLPSMEATLALTACVDPAVDRRVDLSVHHPNKNEESAPILPLDAGVLASYAGLPGASTLHPSASVSTSASPSRMGASFGLFDRPSPSAASVSVMDYEDVSVRQSGVGPRALSRVSDWGAESSTVTTTAPSSVAVGGALPKPAATVPVGGPQQRQQKQASVAAKQPEDQETDDEDDFFDSDDDGGDAFLALPHAPSRIDSGAPQQAVPFESPTTAVPAEENAIPSRTLSKPGSQRFNFKIREAGSGAEAHPSSESLRSAVQGLKLASLLSTSSARRGLDRTTSIASSSAATDADPFAALSGPRAPTPLAQEQDPFDFFNMGSASNVATASSTTAPQPPSTNAGEPMRKSPAKDAAPPSNLLAGWEDFESLFTSPAPSAPLVAPSSSAIPPTTGMQHGPTKGSAFVRQEWKQAAEELRAGGNVTQLAKFTAASLLAIEARTPAEAARLARFAAAVPLEGEEAAVVFWAAAERQVAVKNYGVAATLLSQLVLASMTAVPPEQVQELLNTCDRAGDSNALPPEDTSAVGSLLAACSSVAEAEELIANIVRG